MTSLNLSMFPKIDDLPKMYHTIFCSPALEQTIQKTVDDIRNECDDIPSFLGMKVIVKNSMPRNMIVLAGEGAGIYQFIRLADSFVPIFELFCDKGPEVDIKNSVVGTHFFRANLPNWLLYIHYYRLRLGIRLMSFLKHDSHVWSHPHNFSRDSHAVKLFVKLAQ